MSPPPGVSSAVRVPPIAVVETLRQRESEPDPGRGVSVAETLERCEHPLALLLGYAGPTVHDPDLDRPGVAAGREQRRTTRRAVAERVAQQVDQDPFEQHRVGVRLGQCSETSTATSAPSGPIASRTSGTSSSSATGARLTPSAPASSRLMSSRFSISRVSRSRDSSAVSSSSSRASSLHSTRSLRREVTLALAEASGLRRSWLTAASRADRVRSASATTVARAAAPASSARSWTAAAWAPNAVSRRRSGPRTVPPTRSTRCSPTGSSFGSPGPSSSPTDATVVHSAASSVRSSRATDDRPKVSRARPRIWGNDVSPRRMPPASPARIAASAWARPASVVRRTTRSTSSDTNAATATKKTNARDVVPVGDRERVPRRREEVVEDQRCPRRQSRAPATARR